MPFFKSSSNNCEVLNALSNCRYNLDGALKDNDVQVQTYYCNKKNVNFERTVQKIVEDR